MLWTDKTSIEEFLCKPINKRLYKFYLELKNIPPQIGIDDIDQSVLSLYNEIYYQLTKIEYEDSQNYKPEKYTQEIEDNLGIEYSELFGYKMFYAFLLLRANISEVARPLQNYIFCSYNRTWDERTISALNSIIEEGKKYLAELKPYPCSAKSLESKVLWDDVTKKFDPSSIKEVLNLWPSNEEKITVLHFIEDEFKETIRNPKTIKEGISPSIVIDEQFFSNMYSELEGKVGAAVNEEQKGFQPTQENVEPNTVEEGKEIDELPSVEKMVDACERTKEESLWWGNASWSVTYRIYCILGYQGSKESFIKKVSGWPFKKPFKYTCNRDSLSKPLRSGKISGPLEKWAADGALIRQVNLGERLMEILKHPKKAL